MPTISMAAHVQPGALNLSKNKMTTPVSVIGGLEGRLLLLITFVFFIVKF